MTDTPVTQEVTDTPSNADVVVQDRAGSTVEVMAAGEPDVVVFDTPLMGLEVGGGYVQGKPGNPGPPGPGVPAVGSEGQVLTTVAGQWEAADPTGGGPGGSDLPTPGTDGQLLTSSGGEWEVLDPAQELPAPGAEGQVLTGVDTGAGVVWQPDDPKLPPEDKLLPDAGTEGQVLTSVGGAWEPDDPPPQPSEDKLLPDVGSEGQVLTGVGGVWTPDDPAMPPDEKLVPDVGAEGQVLTTVGGLWEPADAPRGLPEEGPEGSVLGVEGGVWAPVEIPGSDLPAPGTDGQVLTSEGGVWEAADPVDGGTGLPAVGSEGQVLTTVGTAWEPADPIPADAYTNRGVWSASTTYAKNDVVTRNGSSYVCTVDGNTSDPLQTLPLGAVLASYTATAGTDHGLGAGGLMAQPFVPSAPISPYGITIKFDVAPGAGSMTVHIASSLSPFVALASVVLDTAGQGAGSADLIFPTAPVLAAGQTYYVVFQGAANVDAVQIIQYPSLVIVGCTNGTSSTKGGDLYYGGFSTTTSTFRAGFSLRAAGVGTWALLAAKGDAGAAGATWLTGSGAPAGGVGVVGDMYLATNGDYYKKTAASAWTLQGNLLGPTGLPGATWLSGAGAPAGALGVVADMYLDTTNGDYYKKTAAAVWTLQTNLTGPAGPSGQAAGRVFYFDTTDASDIAGYRTALEAPSAAVESTITTSVTGTADVVVEEFATDPGVPGVTDFPAGTANRQFYVATTGNGVARLHIQAFIRTAAGVETKVRDEFSPNFTSATPVLLEWMASNATGGAMSATDRLVIKIWAQRVSGPGTFNVVTYYQGTTHASRMQTTISAGAVGPPGPPGPTYSRASAPVTTASLAPTARASGTVAMAAGYRVMAIQTDVQARVRLYTTVAARDADLTRPIATPPDISAGVVLDYATTAAYKGGPLSPLIDGYDPKVTPDGLIPYTIDNLESVTNPVTCTFTYIRTE